MKKLLVVLISFVVLVFLSIAVASSEIVDETEFLQADAIKNVDIVETETEIITPVSTDCSHSFLYTFDDSTIFISVDDVAYIINKR